MHEYTYLLVPAIKDYLARGDDKAVLETIENLNAPDLAEVFVEVEPEQEVKLFELLPPMLAIHTFEHLDESNQLTLIERADRKKVIHTMEEMSDDDRAALVRALPPETANTLLPLMAQAERNNIKKLCEFPESSAGALMTTEYATVMTHTTIEQAIQQLRQVAPSKETIYYIYIIDEQHALKGVISLRELVLAKPTKQVEEVMNGNPVYVRVTDDQESVAFVIEKYDLLAVPVVDANHKLVGIITHDDALDVVVEESTEDAQKMGALIPLEESYLQTSYWQMVRNRGIWLVLLFLGEMVTATLLEGSVHMPHMAALAVFLPLIIASGGNSGSQAATLITRALATREITLQDWAKIIVRELRSSLAIGTLLGGIGLVTVHFLFKPEHAEIPLTLACTLLLVVVFASVVGSLIPLFFKRVGIDPALASAPFMATFLDVTGIVIYLSVASIIMRDS